MTPLQPFGHYFRDMAGNQHFHTGATPPSFAHSEITPLYAHPSRGVVDEKLEGKLRCLAVLLQQLNAQTACAAVNEAIEALQAAALPAVPSEFMGWVHEVVWIDGTSRRLHQKEPTPLDDTPGLTSQRVVRVFTQPAVLSVPEAKDEAIPYPGGYPSYESHMRAIAEAKGWNACRAAMLAATPAHDQPEGSDNE